MKEHVNLVSGDGFELNHIYLISASSDVSLIMNADITNANPLSCIQVILLDLKDQVPTVPN